MQISENFNGGIDHIRNLNLNDKYYVYLHCKPDGTPFYVGKGINKRAFNFKMRNDFHKKVTGKYGIENIHIHLFFCESEQQALDDEIQWIAQLRKEGYLLTNVTDGGDGTSGWHWSEEQRIKMSISRKGIPNKHNLGKRPRLGIKHTEETKKKISLMSTGKKKPFTEEHKAKISAGLKASKPWIGRVVSQENLAKRSESLKKTWAIRKANKK